MYLLWKLASRNILRNTKRSILTILLISTSVIIVIFSDGFVVGMTENMVKSATRVFSGDAQIHHPEFLQSYDPSYRFNLSGLVKSLQDEPLIAAVTARSISPAMISSSANIKSVQAIGINPDTEKHLSKIESSVIAGNYLTGDTTTEIMIGYLLAEALEVKLNDRVVLSIPTLDQSDVSQDLFRVSGIFQFNTKMMDEGMVFLPLEHSLQLLGDTNSIQEVAFNFVNPKLAEDTSLQIWQKYSSNEQVAQSWTEIFPTLSTLLGMLDYTMLIVGLILYMIVALGVINSMFMSIYERTWEFGVIKAVGTTPQQIFQLIMLEGFILAIISAVIGTLLGLLVNYLVAINGIDYSQIEFVGVTIVDPVKTVIRPIQYSQLPLWVVLLTLIACLYPAIFAARLVPNKALHKSL